MIGQTNRDYNYIYRWVGFRMGQIRAKRWEEWRMKIIRNE